ncbi:MAG TPA: lipase family protein [Candidatus Cybelea sp.]|nr:lipase family protein [Candidatus Cybelea sp.]
MTLPTDAALAALCNDIYQPDAAGRFDTFDAGEDDGICWALKHLAGFDAVALRGSKTELDWLRDFRAFTIPTRIGHVHAGFHEGMEHMWTDALYLLRQPTIVTGHSLGAARASILTALMILDGRPPVARVVFGEPKPGLLDHAIIVKQVEARSYRNGDGLHHDLITDIPFSFPPEQYVHPTPIIPVCARPSGDLFSQLGVFAFHHIQLYQAALAAAHP